MTKIVNSWNDFDPLKHVIVGRADFSVMLLFHSTLDLLLQA